MFNRFLPMLSVDFCRRLLASMQSNMILRSFLCHSLMSFAIFSVLFVRSVGRYVLCTQLHHFGYFQLHMFTSVILIWAYFQWSKTLRNGKVIFFLFLPSEFSLFSFGRRQKKWREMRFHFIICCKCVPFSLLMATYLALFALKLCHVVSHDRHMSFSLSACEELNLFVEPVAVANLLIIFATWQQLN